MLLNNVWFTSKTKLAGFFSDNKNDQRSPRIPTCVAIDHRKLDRQTSVKIQDVDRLLDHKFEQLAAAHLTDCHEFLWKSPGNPEFIAEPHD